MRQVLKKYISVILISLLPFLSTYGEECSWCLQTYQDLPLSTLVVFDSVKVSHFLPLFQAPHVTYQKKNQLTFEETDIEKEYKRIQGNDLLKKRCVRNISLTAPEVIDYYDLKPYDYEIERPKITEKKLRITGLEEELKEPKFEDLRRFMKQRVNSPWKFDGSLSVQFSQYYVTDNWYKGGTPNATLLSIFDYNIDYKKDRLLWENDFDIKIGFYNTSEDTIRAFRVNNDVVRITTLLAYQTWFHKKIFYSAEIDFNTSLFTSYKGTNSNEVVTAFMSPTQTFFSAGMECRYNNKTSIRVAPVAYKLIGRVDDRVNPEHVGLDSTAKCKGYIGYMVQAKLDWKFTKEINLTSKIDFFSSYNAKNIEFNWEVVGKFIINRFLSTRLSLIMRYDNTPMDEVAKIQVQEQLSFGFNYQFK